MPLPEAFHDVARKVNNWGRWGSDDERGTLNLLTPNAVRRGRDSIVSGRMFPLAIPLSEDGPQAGLIPDRHNPVRRMVAINHSMIGDAALLATSDDTVELGLQAATHWDALAHVSHSGKLYNGFPADTITEAGAARCGIDKVGAVVGRGVLLDVPRALGLDRLAGGHVITADDLDAAVALAGVQLQSGDFLLVRTGQMQQFHAGDRIAYAFPSAGPSLEAVTWFHANDVAAVATDSITFEVFPGEVDGLVLPVHLLHLVEMGLLQGQNFDLEALAADCAADGQFTFLLSATPEPFVGGLGGPVAPVAVK